MTAFLADHTTTPDRNWRAIVLFGRNVASYKFALAKTLAAMAAERGDDRVPLSDLAPPFARHLCEHLRHADKQGTSARSPFLDACRSFNRGDLTEEQLVEITVRRGFNDVIKAFHYVGSGPVPVRFFADERGQSGAIRITDDLRRLAASAPHGALADEAEARWCLVEFAWSHGLPPASVAVRADVQAGQLTGELFVERRVRRVNLTGVRPALSGYQDGRCFYCHAQFAPAEVDVDHVFPWKLKQSRDMADADGVWNLVLACRACNSTKRDLAPSGPLVARLHERNNYLVDSHHPLRETIMRQTGASADARKGFLLARQSMARDALVHEWDPPWAGGI